MNISNGWKDYEVISTGNGEKLERFGDVVLRRPDPQIIWEQSDSRLWKEWDGFYHRSSKGGGN